MPPVDVAVVAVLSGPTGAPCVLVTRRGPNGPLPDAWELPGGKVDDGESTAAAAARELREETGLAPEGLFALGTWGPPEGGHPVRLHAFVAHLTGPPPPAESLPLAGPVDARWIPLRELSSWPLPEGNAPITAALLAHARMQAPG